MTFEDTNAFVSSPSESLHLTLTLNASDGDPHGSNALGFLVGFSDSFHYYDDRANIEVMPGYSYDIGATTVTIDDRSRTSNCIPTGKLYIG